MASGTKQVRQNGNFNREASLPSLLVDNREPPTAAQVTAPSIQDLTEQWAAIVRHRYKVY
jgi:hypothetical protein